MNRFIIILTITEMSFISSSSAPGGEVIWLLRCWYPHSEGDSKAFCSPASIQPKITWSEPYFHFSFRLHAASSQPAWHTRLFEKIQQEVVLRDEMGFSRHSDPSSNPFYIILSTLFPVCFFTSVPPLIQLFFRASPSRDLPSSMSCRDGWSPVLPLVEIAVEPTSQP